MIKNLVFDIGNVLVEEVNAHALAWLGPEQQEEFAKLVYYKNPSFIEVLLGHQTIDEHKNQLVKQHPDKAKEIEFLLSPSSQTATLPTKPEMIDILYSLKPHYSIYFLSDITEASYNYLKHILDDFDGGVYSFKEHLKKPNPEFFRILLNRYNLKPEETAFFDDKERNVTAARNLGIKAELFTGPDSIKNIIEQTYQKGFDQ